MKDKISYTAIHHWGVIVGVRNLGRGQQVTWHSQEKGNNLDPLKGDLTVTYLSKSV
jgi:hypothetical protein